MIVLDENKLIQDEFKELFKTATKCRFLVTSSQRKILDSKNAIELIGWEDQDIIFFLENKLQRSLKTEELEAAKALRTLLRGNPTYIKLAVVNIAENGLALNKLVSQLPNTAPEKYIVKQILGSLTHQQLRIIELLAVMGDVGLESKQVVSITQSSENLGTLEDLRQRHLLNFDASRYTLTKVVGEFLSPPSKLLEPLENTLTYFKKTLQKYQSNTHILCSEIDATVHLLEIAVTAGRWQDVINLGMSVESSLALSRRWGLWKQVLQRILQASQAEEEKAIQAWAYHQLGTCFLCLEDDSTATDYLNKAIELRISLDDKAAIVVTRRNLDLLDVAPLFPETNLRSDTMSETAHQLLHPAGESDNKNTQTLPDGDFRANDEQVKTRIYRKGQSFKFFRNPSPKKASLSSRGIIATGVFVTGGLLGWFGWDRLTVTENSTSSNSQSPSSQSPSSQSPSSQSPSSRVESIPTPTPTRSWISEPEPTHQSPVPEPDLPSSLAGSPPAPDPPLTPSVEHQHPNKGNIYNFNPKLILPSQENKSKPQSELTPEPGSTPISGSPSPIIPPITPTVKPSIKNSPSLNPNPLPTATPNAKTSPTVAPTPIPTTPSTISPELKASPSEKDESLPQLDSNQLVPEPIPVPRFTPIQ